MLEKNSEITLEITDVSPDGAGVGFIDNMAVFAPFSVIGETVRVKILKVNKTYAFGKVTEVLKPSDYRKNETDCDVFPKCGGCVFRHLEYEGELEVKQKIVANAFRKFEIDIEPILECKNVDGYRNKVQYPVRTIDNRPSFGFFASNSHILVQHKKCLLQEDIFYDTAKKIIDFCIKNHIEPYNEADNSGLLRHISIRKGHYSNELQVCLVLRYACRVFDKLKIPHVININRKKTNVIFGDKTIGDGRITDTVCGNKVILSPESFYQVNTPQAENLYKIAKDFSGVTEEDTVLDLFCGSGTISMYLAKSAKKVIGIEIDKCAVDNAKENAELNGIKNIDFICADLADYKLKEACDIVILDPPRKGITPENARRIVLLEPKRIVMISCNPITAARDCENFGALGYGTVRIKPVDMFPRTKHIECVILLEKIDYRQLTLF